MKALNTQTQAKRLWLCPARIRPAVLLWALGVPLPIILVIVVLRGCI